MWISSVGRALDFDSRCRRFEPCIHCQVCECHSPIPSAKPGIWRADKSLVASFNGGVSSVGRASDCESEGHGFEPRTSPHFFGCIAQQVERRVDNAAAGGSIPSATTMFCPGSSIGRVAVSNTDGWGFESLLGCQFFDSVFLTRLSSDGRARRYERRGRRFDPCRRVHFHCSATVAFAPPFTAARQSWCALRLSPGISSARSEQDVWDVKVARLNRAFPTIYCRAHQSVNDRTAVIADIVLA